MIQGGCRMRRIRRVFCLFSILAAVMLGGTYAWADGQNEVVPGAGSVVSTSKHEFYAFEYAKDYLKQQLVRRENEITFTVRQDSRKDIGKALLEAALEVTEDTPGTQGDYLDLHIEAYKISPYQITAVYNTKRKLQYYEHTITYSIRYYTTWDQEKAMNERVSQVLDDLDLDDLDTYEKIEKIYNYVCKRVSYDYDTSGNTGKFSAYNALVKKKAVCQGYASLIYRMMRQAGVECRVIKGTSNGVAHSWNIVRIGQKYYNIDATWDAGSDPDDYKYFLKTEAEFKDHTREAQYKTASFSAAYPMATESYCFGNHEWSSEYTVDVEATCSSYGIQSIHCLRCDAVKEGSLRQIKKKSHTYGSWKVVKKATIFEEGEKQKTCKVCGAKRTSSIKKLTAKVTLNASSVRMKVGQISTGLAIKSQNSQDYVKRWSSSNSSVVSVGRKTGKLKAKKKGTAVITVTMASGAKATCKVTVSTKTIKATAISFPKKKTTMRVGETMELNLTVKPVTASDKITYVVSKNGVLSLTKDGKIKAKKTGVAYVKATTKSGLTAKCRITVKSAQKSS